MTGVWIELPKPKDAVDAGNICNKANNMMGRLMGGTLANHFTWNDTRKRYERGRPMRCETLEHFGKWCNLAYLGRPL